MGHVNWLRSMSWKKRIGVAAGAGFTLFLLLVGIGYAATSVPNPNKVAIEQATRVLYADGSVMGIIGTNRQIVPLDKINKDAQHAVLAAEDRNFYNEPGISLKGIGRALFSNIRAGGVSEGGSTITQQYAKNAFLTQDRTITRKVKEVFIALKMSRTVSKDTVLEDYLNTIYFGRGAYGIEAAAQTYFGSGAHAANLTPPQAALLAAVIQSPSRLDPARHLDRVTKRWNYVLDGMVSEKWLSAADRSAAKFPRVQAIGSRNSFPGSLDRIRAQVIDDLGKQGFPEDRITAGGLIVRTTILRRAQEAAIKAVEGPVPGTGDGNHPVAALVSVEPGTGKVIAYYGGGAAGGFDYAGNDKKGVQPGSGMKPYVLAAALEEGKSLDTRYDGSSPQQICGGTVSNDSGDPPFGQVDLATGLQHSINTVYYRLACDVGAQRVADAAHAAGIPDTDKLADDVSGKPTAQIALGSGGYEIHPLDQATGYATFAAKGMRARPYFVQRVTDSRGNELYKAKGDTGKAFSEGVAADVTYAMQQVVKGGTGTNAQLGGRPTAGKTGTTQKNQNAWFTGFTPQLSTSVWIGMSGGGTIKGINGVNGSVYGGTAPAMIFKEYMTTALEGTKVLDFPPRAGVGAPATAPPSTAVPTATATATATPSVLPTVSLPPVLPTQSQTPSPTPSATPPAPTNSPTPDASPPPPSPAATP